MIQLVLGLLLALQTASPGALAKSGEEPVLVSQVPAPEPPTPSPPEATPPPAPPPRTYQPPRTGQPRGRMAAITRAAGEQVARPLALAPTHVAETIRARPKLYWAIDRLHPGPVIFTLNRPDVDEPVCELNLASPSGAGASAIDLAACPKDLEPGIEYEWFVAVVADPAKRALDQITQAWIRRVPPPAELDAAKATPSDLAHHGLWYDALERAVAQRDQPAWELLLGELSISSVELPR
ncbi:MAG TPA: DUF928 domain-containing protein [Myxococcota bacterium]|nr:DUF928 domain-containing protein [Myxococcota bacterium]